MLFNTDQLYLSRSRRKYLYKILSFQISKGGLSASQAIQESKEMYSSRKMKKILDGVRLRMAKGQSFSIAMKPLIPNNEYLMLATSEMKTGSGNDKDTSINLGDMLNRCSELNNQANEMKKILIQKLTYPIMLLSLSLLLIVFIKNKFLDVVINSGILSFDLLPKPLQNIYDTAVFFQNRYIPLGVITIALIVFINQSLKMPRPEKINKLPIYGMYKNFVCASFISNLSQLTSLGISFDQSLSIIKRSSNSFLKSYITKIQNLSKDGVDSYMAIARSNLFDSEINTYVTTLAKFSPSGFQDNLIKLAEEIEVRQREKIVKIGAILNVLGMLIVFGLLAYLMVGMTEFKDVVADHIR